MASNYFRKSFYTSSCIWLCMENRIFRKNISFDRKIKVLTHKLFYVFIFTSNHLWTQRERERERESLWLRATKYAGKIAPHEACRRLTSLVLLWVKSSPPLGRSCCPPLADLSPPLGRSRCWFAFSLWSLILLLLLWWCGWWHFVGFCVVWWWVLCG